MARRSPIGVTEPRSIRRRTNDLCFSGQTILQLSLNRMPARSCRELSGETSAGNRPICHITRASSMELNQETQATLAPDHRTRFGMTKGRVIFSGIVAAGIALFLVWMWRVRELHGLPDVGDPFDISQARRPIEISEDDNAYVAYSQAQQLLTRMPNSVRQVQWSNMSWATAGPDVRDYFGSE